MRVTFTPATGCTHHLQGPAATMCPHHLLRSDADADLLEVRTELIVDCLNGNKCHLHPQAPKDTKSLSSSVYHRLPQIMGMGFLQTINTIVAVVVIAKALRLRSTIS